MSNLMRLGGPGGVLCWHVNFFACIQPCPIHCQRCERSQSQMWLSKAWRRFSVLLLIVALSSLIHDSYCEDSCARELGYSWAHQSKERVPMTILFTSLHRFISMQSIWGGLLYNGVHRRFQFIRFGWKEALSLYLRINVSSRRSINSPRRFFLIFFFFFH